MGGVSQLTRALVHQARDGRSEVIIRRGWGCLLTRRVVRENGLVGQVTGFLGPNACASADESVPSAVSHHSHRWSCRSRPRRERRAEGEK